MFNKSIIKKCKLMLTMCLAISIIYCSTVYATPSQNTDAVKKDNPAWYNDTSYKAKEDVEDTRKKTRDMQKKMLNTSLASYQPSEKLVTPNLDLNATSGADKSTPPSTDSSSSSTPAQADNKDKMNPLHVTGLPTDKLSQAVKKKSPNSVKLKYMNEYVEAEKKYGVNSVFLLALTIQESGWDEKSNGISATHHNPFSLRKNSKEYYSYSTYKEGVDAGVKNLKNNYLTKGGKYYKGDSIEDISRMYLGNGSVVSSWSNGIKTYMKTIYDAIGQ